MNERASIDGENLTYEVPAALLSEKVSTELSSQSVPELRAATELAAQIANGTSTDAALGLRWTGGTDYDPLGSHTHRSSKGNTLEATTKCNRAVGPELVGCEAL